MGFLDNVRRRAGSREGVQSRKERESEAAPVRTEPHLRPPHALTHQPIDDDVSHVVRSEAAHQAAAVETARVAGSIEAAMEMLRAAGVKRDAAGERSARPRSEAPGDPRDSRAMRDSAMLPPESSETVADAATLHPQRQSAASVRQQVGRAALVAGAAIALFIGVGVGYFAGKIGDVTAPRASNHAPVTGPAQLRLDYELQQR